MERVSSFWRPVSRLAPRPCARWPVASSEPARAGGLKPKGAALTPPIPQLIFQSGFCHSIGRFFVLLFCTREDEGEGFISLFGTFP